MIFLDLKRYDELKKELELYDRHLDAMRSSVSQLETAEEICRAEGRAQATLELAQQLLDVLDVATIAKKTGLTVKELQQLKKK
jgi:predicted transposase/invertase (TIGR01784 family)